MAALAALEGATLPGEPPLELAAIHRVNNATFLL